MINITKFTVVIAAIIVLVGCNKDEGNLQQGEGKVEFGIGLQNPNSTLKSSTNAESVSAIVVDIEDANGNAIYTNEEIKLHNFNGALVSSPISLKIGNYNLTKFLAINAESNVVYATPTESSKTAYLVEEPLPINISVNKDVTLKVTPEVVSAKTYSPADFGYTTYGLNIKETFYFLIGAFIYNSEIENLELTNASIIVKADGTEIYSGDLGAFTNTIVINDGYENYTITVSKEGYANQTEKYTAADLKLHANNPIEIILEEECKDCPQTLTDIDGNIYKVIQIGDQCWMAENLKVTHFPDGTPIPHVPNDEDWLNLADNNTDAAYCFYNNDESLGYGALYTYAAAKEVCPDGWHLPSDEEWRTLELYLTNNGYNYDGSIGYSSSETYSNRIGKALASATGWHVSDEIGKIGNKQETNNASGFNVLPVGIRSFHVNSSGVEDACFYDYEGESSYFWTSTEYPKSEQYDYKKLAMVRAFSYYNSFVFRGFISKSRASSVRYIKD